MEKISIKKNIEKDLLYQLIPHKQKMFLLSGVKDWSLDSFDDSCPQTSQTSKEAKEPKEKSNVEKAFGLHGKRTLTSFVKITKDDIFFDSTICGVPSYVAFEYMAQSISCISGIQGRLEGRPPKLGVILSVSGLETFCDVFCENDVVFITIEEDCQVDLIYTFLAKAFVKKQNSNKQSLAVSAALTVMETNDMSLKIKNKK